MASYALVNWTARKTQGPFHTPELAREALAKNVGPGDEWSIIQLPEYVGAGTEIETGRGTASA